MPSMPDKKTVLFSPLAEKDISNIIRGVIDYTSHYSSGENLLNALRTQITMLGFLPKMGKKGIVENTREIFCRSYRIIYTETATEVIILKVIHSRRKYP